MKYILTLDEGTTSVRAILYNIKNNSFDKIEKKTFKQYFPYPAWVEHDAEEIWQKAKECLISVCKDVDICEIAGLGITNQRETVVAWDKFSGKPLCKAIVWQCRRTSKYCEKLKKNKISKKIREKTGLIPDAYFSATKIKWLLENNLNVKQALNENRLLVGTVESYLVYRLTEGKSFVSDVTNASRTMLFNIKTMMWDDDLLKYFEIPKNILAKIVNNDEIVGETNILGKPIKIAGLIGDQQSSLFGQCCFDKGLTKNTYGTGCFMLMNTGGNIVKSKKGLLTTVGFKISNKTSYALEGSVFNAGSVVDWAITNLELAKNPQELTTLAYSVENSGGVYLVPAFTGLGTPYWDMNARALICGLTRGVDKRHISRAVLESMAFSSYDVLKTMENDTKLKIKELHVDGGASQNDRLMQFQCDLLQTKLKISNTESTCMGAIYLTGLACKVFNSLNQIKESLKEIKNFIPVRTKKDVSLSIKDWNLAVKRCLKN